VSAAGALSIEREVRLADRYELERGTVLLSGVQALVRLVFDQMRADRAAGRSSATLVSGYQGSPLGGLDRELVRQRALMDELDVVFRAGLNEDLAATSVWGSQLVPGLRGARYEGVLGVWYGKAPGVDRSGDALRHGNFIGSHPRGGLLAICGDDPSCKSSTLPSASEETLAALRMPVLAPGSPQEVLDVGRHAVALSRASGLWAALKVVTNVADGVGSVEVGLDRVQPRHVEVEDGGRPYIHEPNAHLIAAATNEMERTLAGPRLALARAYARANGLNAVVVDPRSAWLTIVAGGATYHDVREALLTLGLGDGDLRDHGIRLLKLGMLWPVDREAVRAAARGTEEVLVVEDKGPFVETAVREALYDLADRPRVVGKEDGEGRPLLAASGMQDVDAIARAVAARILRRVPVASAEARLRELEAAAPEVPSGGGTRMPFFCSGCPHNRSTDAPDDALVGAGIGCHGMVVISPAGKGDVQGATQMGGEGAQWIGQAPFVDRPHLFQNLGDGTFHHSGSLAVRAAVAAGANITYKLLHNRAVAMTGGQDVEGGMDVPELTRMLEAEGVRRIVVTTDEPAKYRGVPLAGIAEVRPRSQLAAVQEELRVEPGVTVLLHDQACAAEKRRLRKRGVLPVPAHCVAINERVCEGCGDCGRKSHCLSLVPVETEFGTKTRIDQASCNLDESCLDGDCPSFLTVVPGDDARRPLPAPPAGLPEPQLRGGDEVTVRLVGIGGTGVVTVAQVLGMAAMLDGRRTLGLDQTGLAQKGGPVVSDVRILPPGGERAGRAPTGSVDCLLALDLVAATSAANLKSARRGRTVAVISTSDAPAGDSIGDPAARPPDREALMAAIDAVSDPARNVRLDARALADVLLGDTLPANMLALGAAWQRGVVPVSLAALEQAVRLNGAAVDQNLAALAWGRAIVAAPDAVTAAGAADALPRPAPHARVAGLVAETGAAPGTALAEVVAVRVQELAAFQSERYARRYARAVRRVVDADRRVGGDGAAPVAVARQLYRLLAYKDEYEVARLHLDPAERARLARQFGEGARVRYRLQPPLLRAMGLERKLSLGRWFDPALRGLVRARRLRGTPFDPFGYAKVRRVERALADEYLAVVDQALPHLASAPETVVELLEAPDVIRGYEDVKLRNVAAWRGRMAELLDRL
jgi:indolepyruvate ferredoxin oxidoreductase